MALNKADLRNIVLYSFAYFVSQFLLEILVSQLISLKVNQGIMRVVNIVSI